MTNRKDHHIDLALKAQTKSPSNYGLCYEPLLNIINPSIALTILGKPVKAPFFISSMTGGTQKGLELNKAFAAAASKYSIPMGLGSCRCLLESNDRIEEFSLRSVNPEGVIFANLGIAQIAKLLKKKEISRVNDLIKKIDANGIFIHINPLQEFFQPEGDLIDFSIIDAIRDAVNEIDYPVFIKEVGQGMGPASLRSLLSLPIAGFEFASFGGTNFSLIEKLRNKNLTDQAISNYSPFLSVGHSATEMCAWLKDITVNESCKTIIISGGIENVLHGYSLMEKLSNKPFNVFIGQASHYLEHALEGDSQLNHYIETQLTALKLAKSYMRYHE